MFKRKIVSALLLCLAITGCSGADAPRDDSGSSPIAAESEQGVGQAELTLSVSNAQILAGTLSKDSQLIHFEFQRSGDSTTATIRDQDGNVLIEASSSLNHEQIAFGDSVILSGPVGSVLGRSEPDWTRVHVEGHVASAHDLLQHPDFALVNELPALLLTRTDVDPAVMPQNGFDLSQPNADADAPGQVRPLSHDPVGCGFCHAACAASVVVCVGLTWGIFAWLCAPPGIACHLGCAGSACQ